MIEADRELFLELMKVVTQECYENSASHGFWDEDPVVVALKRLTSIAKASPSDGRMWRDVLVETEAAIAAHKGRNRGEMVALMHSELSELLEGVRKPAPDSHCPEFTSEEIEAADVFIRLGDYCAGHKLRLGAAVLAKMEFNASRPHKHGKAF